MSDRKLYKRFAKLLLRTDKREQLKQLLVQIDVNYVHPDVRFPGSDDGSTALCAACEFRDAELVQLLLLRGADANLKDANKISPLDSVVIGRSPDSQSTDSPAMWDCIQLLLQYGATLELGEVALEFVDDYPIDVIIKLRDLLD